jgi:RNA polymerase sigma factor (sigma-70 family)
MQDPDSAVARGEERDRDLLGGRDEYDSPQQGFEWFFAQYQERLVRGMYLLTGDRIEAEDLAQEAFVRIYERWDKVAKMSSPAGYLFRTALNLNRRRLRRLLRFVSPSHVHDVSSEVDPEAVAVVRSDVAEALRSLTRAQREVVVLREWLELRNHELAKVLGISPESARVRLHRARQLLRERLEGNNG